MIWREAWERGFPLVVNEKALSKIRVRGRDSFNVDVSVKITEETK